MNSRPVVKVKNVSKVYPRKPQTMKMRGDTLFSFLQKKLFKGVNNNQPFQALKDVSFSVYAGESVGIIGYNGAGKSTLLRIITGITEPTVGNVEIIGKYGELFALNSGFNQDLSGRKNIYLLAAIKGFSPNEIEKDIGKIIDFSELGDFIDQPVKVYSSGMRSRLGFSILIHLLPDIIFIDEALATGDQKFREKCQERLDELLTQNKTLVIVSHSLGSIKSMCSRAIWLEKGQIKMDGDVTEVTAAYENDKKTREPK